MTMLMESRPSAAAVLQTYVPGTRLPIVGSEKTLTFEQAWNYRKRSDTWQATVDVVTQGKTIYVLNDASDRSPDQETRTWRTRIYRILDDKPSHDDPSLYHRVIIVDLIEPVTQSVTPRSSESTSAPKQAELAKLAATPARKRILNGVCFIKSGDNLSFTFIHADSTVEEFVLEGENLPGLICLRGGDGTRFTNPLSVEVTREIDIQPKFKKYAVRRR